MTNIGRYLMSFLGNRPTQPREMIFGLHVGYSRCRGPFVLFESVKRGGRKGGQRYVGAPQYRWLSQKW